MPTTMQETDGCKAVSSPSTRNVSDSEQNTECNGFTTPQQSTSELKHYDNSIFNTLSKIVNRTAKVIITQSQSN